MAMKGLAVGEVTTDSLNLGRRDAFHVPGVQVRSAQTLVACDSVRFVAGSCTDVAICDRPLRHGIVDPFVREPIIPGRLFWIFLEPEIVGNLTHHFEIEGVPSRDYDEYAGDRVECEEITPEPASKYDTDDEDDCSQCYRQ